MRQKRRHEKRPLQKQRHTKTSRCLVGWLVAPASISCLNSEGTSRARKSTSVEFAFSTGYRHRSIQWQSVLARRLWCCRRRWPLFTAALLEENSPESHRVKWVVEKGTAAVAIFADTNPPRGSMPHIIRQRTDLISHDIGLTPVVSMCFWRTP